MQRLTQRCGHLHPGLSTHKHTFYQRNQLLPETQPPTQTSPGQSHKPTQMWTARQRHSLRPKTDQDRDTCPQRLLSYPNPPTLSAPHRPVCSWEGKEMGILKEFRLQMAEASPPLPPHPVPVISGQDPRAQKQMVYVEERGALLPEGFALSPWLLS